MPITDLFRVNRIKDDLEKAQQERDALKTTVANLGQLDAATLVSTLQQLGRRKDELVAEISQLEVDLANRRKANDRVIEDLDRQIVAKRQHLVILDEETLLQSFGLYKPKYRLESSSAYKGALDIVQSKQSDFVKAGKAAQATQTWTINGSTKEGEKMVKEYVKLILRAFNNECDAAIAGVKYNNVESMTKRIEKAFDSLNALGERMHISIAEPYFKLRLQELHLVYEYQQKRQEEREEQRRIREQMREEAKVMREIEEMKLKIEKEEKHFKKAIEAINKQLERAKSAAEQEAIQREKDAILAKLQEVEHDKLDVINRERNTRAGYVYVISNLGSFGEDVYKIGVTRRLDPQERIDELGDASVPFDFDVHALIFSDDAPALENALHKAFADRRLNLVNQRREFFKVSLPEIKTVVQTNFGKPVEFVDLAEAEEFRESVQTRLLA
jgi:hypothetical protein